MSAEIRSGGLMLYYVLIMLLTSVGALFCLAGQDVEMPRWWLVVGVALVAAALGLLLYCARRDAWNTTRLVLIFSLLFVGLCGMLAWGVEAPAAFPIGLVGLVVGGLCAAYLAWRAYGAELAPDVLVGEGVMEIDGIAIRLPRRVDVRPGRIAWVQLDLQNAWTVPIEFRLRLRSWGKRALRMPKRVVQQLGPLEAGSIRFPIKTHARAKGRLRVSVAVQGRGRAWLARRGRLRPKPPLPVGPMWLLTVMGAGAGEALLYRSASFEIVFRKDVEATLESDAAAGWTSTWRRPQDRSSPEASGRV